MSETDIPHQDITYCIIGAAMRVHRRTPRGLREKHYQEALTAEMVQDGLVVSQDHHLEFKRILPPKSVQDWQKNIAKYLWQPSSSATDRFA